MGCIGCREQSLYQAERHPRGPAEPFRYPTEIRL